MIRKTTMFAMAGTAVLGALIFVPAYAQTGGARGADISFETLDTDSDGVLSREEWQAFMADGPMANQRTREGWRMHGDDRKAERRGARRESGAEGEAMPERRVERMSDRMREDMMERMPDAMRERVRERMGARTGDRMRDRRGDHDMGGAMYGRMGAMTPEGMADRMMERFDADGDGMLSRDELLDGFSAMSQQRDAMRAMRDDPAARADFMFDMIDADGDGVISREEFGAMQERWHGMRRGPGRMAPAENDGPIGD